MLIFRETDDFIHFSDDINTSTSSGNDVLLVQAGSLQVQCANLKFSYQKTQVAG